jgi:hypothetical protein
VVASYFSKVEDDTRFPYPEEEVSVLVKELLMDSEAATSATLVGMVGYTERKMPTVRKIYQHWGLTLVKLNKFDSLFEVEDGDHSICWACGMVSEQSLERAHILPRNIGGTDDVANLHMLCVLCHKISEDAWGKQYWNWFMNAGNPCNPPELSVRFFARRLAKMGICTEDEFMKNHKNDQWIIDNGLIAKLEEGLKAA